MGWYSKTMGWDGKSDEQVTEELTDLYEFAQGLNEIGFNLSLTDLEQEAQEYGVSLERERK